MSNNKSIWRRIQRLLRSKTTRVLDNMETVEDLAHQELERHEDKLGEFRQNLADAIKRLRIMEAEQATDIKSIGELELEVQSSVARTNQLKAENNDPVNIARNEALLAALVDEYELLTERVEARVPQIALLSERVEGLKGIFQDAQQNIEKARSKRDMLVARAKSAQSLEQAMAIAEDTGALENPLASLSPLEQRVREIEGRAAATVEIADASPVNQRRALEREIRRGATASKIQNLLDGGTLEKPNLSAPQSQITSV